jgi:hypothetical protein
VRYFEGKSRHLILKRSDDGVLYLIKPRFWTCPSSQVIKTQRYFHFPLLSSFQTSVCILLIFIAHVSVISCRQILITGVYNVSVL